jgi:hypothetical protein
MADVPFEVMLQQAADMKTEYLKADKKKFDSYPSWLQSTIFANKVPT